MPSEIRDMHDVIGGRLSRLSRLDRLRGRSGVFRHRMQHERSISARTSGQLFLVQLGREATQRLRDGRLAGTSHVCEAPNGVVTTSGQTAVLPGRNR